MAGKIKSGDMRMLKGEDPRWRKRKQKRSFRPLQRVKMIQA